MPVRMPGITLIRLKGLGQKSSLMSPCQSSTISGPFQPPIALHWHYIHQGLDFCPSPLIVVVRDLLFS